MRVDLPSIFDIRSLPLQCGQTGLPSGHRRDSTKRYAASSLWKYSLLKMLMLFLLTNGDILCCISGYVKYNYWIRIPGPDDIFAKASKEIAEKEAAEHNQWLSEWYTNQTELKRELLPTLERMQAVVEPWPYSEKAHAENLLEQKET